MYRQFQFPDEQEFSEALGVRPRYLEFEDVMKLDIFEVSEEDLTFSYSVTGRSVKLSWRKEECLQLEAFREGVTRIHVIENNRSTSLSVEYCFADARGKMEVQIFPYVKVEDRLFFS